MRLLYGDDNEMKKIIIVLLIFVILIGCGKVPEDTSFNKDLTPNIYDGNSVYVFTDAKTGCDYFIYKNGYAGGITPRLDSDGKPLCNK